MKELELIKDLAASLDVEAKEIPLDDEFKYQDGVSFQIRDNHVVSLGIGNLELTHLKQIIEFSKLETFILALNQIADLSPLANLSQLSELDLFNNQIADLSPLVNLSQLSTLDLQHNQIADLSPLANLSQLSELYLQHNQIADLSPLANLSQLSTLYLFNNQIADFSPLANLSQLSTLDLQHNQIADLSPLANLSQLSTLFLSENQIADLSPLPNLSQLSTLYLSDNQIADLSPLPNLSQLSTLYLKDNQIADLSPLANLSQLSTLDLKDNQIADLSPLANLSQLSTLDLSYNQIADISPLANLSQLSTLDLKDNQIADLSPLANLSQLSTLDLHYNQIANLSPLANLSQLSELHITYNQIADLSPIANLSQLSTLNLQNNYIVDLSPLANLSQLSTLYLLTNQITDLSPLANLSQLSQLHLTSNQIADLSPLANLSQLSELSLSNNKIADLSPLANLSQLSKLYLDKNQIADLSPLTNIARHSELHLSCNQIADLSPFANIRNIRLDTRGNIIETLDPSWFQKSKTVIVEELDKFIHLQSMTTPTLVIDGKHLISPPVELIGKPKLLKAYFKQCGDLEAIAQLKILVLGAGAAGKTSLIKLLDGQDFDSKEPQTHGINITKLPVTIDGKEVTTRVWDFGGQEIMHATHKFFLSRRSLFIVVLDGRSEEDPEHWLSHARTYGDSPPTIVVMNKIDANPNYGVEESELKRKYPFIRAFVRTSAKKKKGIEELRSMLTRFAAEIPMVRLQLPKAWVAIMNELEQSPEPYFNFDKIKEVCTKQGLNYKNQQEYMIQFLNDLGVAVHVPKRQTFDTFVLNPEWATQGVYRLINHPKVQERQGLIPDNVAILTEYLEQPWYPDQKALPDHLKNFTYPQDKHNFLLELLQHFELCYYVKSPEPGVLAPTHLPVDPPAFDFDHREALQMRVAYDGFLPPSVLPRLMVKRYRELKRAFSGRHLMVAEERSGHTQAVVRADRTNRHITLRVKGHTAQNYFAVLRDSLQEINDDINDSLYTVQLGCRCALCRTQLEPFFYNFNDLLIYYLDGDDTVRCGKSHQKVPIAMILGEVFDQQDEDIKEIRDMVQQTPTNEVNEVNEDERHSKLKKLWAAIEVKPGIAGIKVDVKKALETLFRRNRG